ncbi:MAG: SLBB domain-containing protein [Candidatus Eisenbacteria bacterium]
MSGHLRRLTLACLLLVGVAFATSAQAQSGGSTSLLDALRQLQGGSTSTSDAPTTETGPATWSVEAPIDPATYRLLPGDGIHVGLWGETPKSWTLRVSPEGDLIVPMAGPVAVEGLSLVEAEQRVRNALQPLYPRAKVSLRLVEPGRFRVSVSGLVTRPGVYEATASDRLSMALVAAGGIRAGASIRSIRVIGRDGEAEVIDLMPWLLRGELAANPTLRPGMSIEVPLRGPTVRVRGPVQGRSGLELTPDRATRFADRPEEEPDLVIEWQAGDSVGSLLAAVGGLNDHATGRGALIRAGSAPRTLDLTSAEATALPVEANDLLEIDYATRWVYITGAVRQPGRYPYLPGMRAIDYVAMAGGPSELGRAKGWGLRDAGGHFHTLDPMRELAPGDFLRVPERRSYKVTTFLAPLSSATAVVLSIIAIANR